MCLPCPPPSSAHFPSWGRGRLCLEHELDIAIAVIKPQKSQQLFVKKNISHRNQYNTTHLILYRSHQPLSYSQTHTHHFEMPTRKHKKTCFRAYLCSPCPQHGNLHQSSATTSRAGWSVLSCGPTLELALVVANTETTLGKCSGENAGKWTRRVEINKEEIHGSKSSMRGYILTYSRL